MGKCSSYRTKEKIIYSYAPFYSPYYNRTPRYVTVGVCYGTKECDECSCGGDKTKCDFYPEVREKAKKDITIEDAIAHFKHGITHDIFSEPVTTYAKMAVEALEKQIKR